jgi:pyruvate ferredoxin oxidoreductase alpha subunit
MDKKYVMVRALKEATGVIEEIGKEYAETFDSHYVGLLEPYRCDDADLVFVTMGFITPTVRFVVDGLRDEGVRAGVLKIRTYRPFPERAIADILGRAKVAVIIERNSLEMVFRDVRSALYATASPPLIMGRAVGIGGRRVSTYDIMKIAQEGADALKTGKIEKEYDWEPIKTLDFDPFEEDVLD